MTDDRSRATRLLGIAGYLSQRNRLTTGRQIADDFGIAIRTVYRDIEDIRAMGLPIAGERGVGFSLTPDQFVEWVLCQALRNPRAGRARPNYAERRIAAAMEQS